MRSGFSISLSRESPKVPVNAGEVEEGEVTVVGGPSDLFSLMNKP